jgi:phosphoesterase RecJ-like protein
MVDYQPMLDALSQSKRVLVTTHVRPDGDALGSTAAMVMGLRSKGIDSQVLLLSHLPSKYAFVFDELGITHLDVENGWPGSLLIGEFDAFLVVDTGTWSQLPGMKELLAGFRGRKLVVDHHLTQEDWADTKLVVTTAAAAGEIAEELLSRWNVELTKPIATAVFVALVADTGWFQFSNTTAHTMRLAAKLIEAGVDTDRVYQLLYQNERPQRLALQTRAQGSLELLAGGKLAVMRITREDFAAVGASVNDTENLINYPLQIRTVEVSLCFTEPADDGPIRVSLRSKGRIDVAKFAQHFGGGGHARAAGLKVPGTLTDVHDKVVGRMIETFKS